jgi:hypothetical protein
MGIEEQLQPEREFQWERDDVLTKVYNSDDGDFVIEQRRSGETHAVSHYRDQGTMLFAAAMMYHIEMHGSPPTLEVINNIQRHTTPHHKKEDDGDMSKRYFVGKKVPQCVDGTVTLTLDETFITDSGYDAAQNPYQVFREGDDLVIGRGTKTGEESEFGFKNGGNGEQIHADLQWKRQIILPKEDALRLLKGIYYFASDKETLHDVHASVAEWFASK